MPQNPRSGRRYTRAVHALKTRAAVQKCFTCQKILYAAAPARHPRAITLGHVIAAEDRPDLFWDPANHAPQCGPCNYADGARRTNAKRRAKRAVQRRVTYTNPAW